MDLKGISWVGNICQKFEAMCLEVEEIMYQDTVKYVENQVQTAGSNVKKFYSEVMQDLLPPSFVDAPKGSASDLPLELFADIGICMKPKEGLKEYHVKVDDIEKLTEDPKMVIDTSSYHPHPFHRISHVDNLFPRSQVDTAGCASKQYGKGSLSKKSSLGAKKRSKKDDMSMNEKSREITFSNKYLNEVSSFCEPSIENPPEDSTGGASKRFGEGCENVSPNEKSGVITPLDKYLTKASSIFKLSNEDQKASFDQKAEITIPGTVEVTRDESTKESENETENSSEQITDSPTDGPSSHTVNLVESGMSKEINMTFSSRDSSLARANDGVVSLIESCATDKVARSEIALEEDFVCNSGRSDDHSTDVNEVDISIEHDLEIVQQVDEAKFEESCVMVNGDEFHFVPHHEGKSKSYKKKIQDVFSPKKRSARKHEYEQLAIWPGNNSNPNLEECSKVSVPSLTIEDAKGSPLLESCESEWEFL